MPESPDDSDQQIALVDEALQACPDAFVFTPVHERAVDGDITRIDAASIALVNIINRMHRGNRIAFVGSDDRARAEQVRQVVGKIVCHFDYKQCGQQMRSVLVGVDIKAVDGQAHAFSNGISPVLN